LDTAKVGAKKSPDKEKLVGGKKESKRVKPGVN
jgi:hypothetical protein